MKLYCFQHTFYYWLHPENKKNQINSYPISNNAQKQNLDNVNQKSELIHVCRCFAYCFPKI